MSHKFVIVGAGLSGLSNAFFIKHFFPKAQITLVEQSNRVGGMIISNNRNGFICEEGPRSIRMGKYNRPLYHILNKIGLYKEFVPSIQQPYSYIYWNGKLNAVPLQMNLETISQFVQDNGSGDVFKLIKAYPKMLFKKLDTDNLGDYLELVLGRDLTEKYAESVFYGIYGESVYNLSKALCYQKSHMKGYDEQQISKDLSFDKDFEQARDQKLKGANSYRFKEGVESLPKRMHAYLQETYESDYKVKLNSKAKCIDLSRKELVVESREEQEEQRLNYDYLILNAPTHQLSQIMINSNLNKVGEMFRGVKCNTLVTRNICWDQKILPKEFKGFGYLINPKQQQVILGMVADSLSFPSQYPENATNLSVMSIYDVNDHVILSELSKHLGVKIPDPKEIVTKSWSKAFTQFSPGHQEEMKKIESELNAKSIIIGANNYTLAIPELVYLSYSKVKQLYL
ncbi:unnamed protein product (macronuclear) [Paramecium tetraurelia]|uniref:Protoporphyrinogen oxidase n=1 Tax=Paramecium tetraurelia TaxID=5888 RepID=A0D1G0_PARTE|nr:uncharacterized protein GSPATT00012401001 [Paramecium tetraurelia]CAK76877.1 unnamed protein product [Paramecium tetraurelia]|eukprot:XP_001444274.1 hypothetical protein (macronuclear) [Paramecium tetraurelia strain d4-2]